MSLVQHKNEVSSKVLALLIELRDSFKMNWQVVGSKVGVAPSTLSRISTGKSTGGRQLLASLELLKELTEMKASGVRTNPDLHQELEAQIITVEIAEQYFNIQPA